MRILIIHPENKYFAGAEKVMGYFLDELVKQDCEVAVATVEGSGTAKLLPQKVRPIWLEGNRSFSPGLIWGQARLLKRKRTEFPFDLIHGWTARDWELASLAGWLCGRIAIGTLHDHPNARFVSPKRRRLMRWCAYFGLKKIVCVSAAVKKECAEAGYPPGKLAVVHNGIPDVAQILMKKNENCFRVGFLGAFSERKGLRDLFQIADKLAENNDAWELHLAGNAQNESGERLMAELHERYQGKSWWRRIYWHGWVESPRDFLKTLDVLVVPSNEFDPFPTVLLEAGQMGLPVLAANVGGVPEIVVDGETGRLFEPGNVSQAVAALNQMISQPDLGRQMGRQACERIKNEFSAAKMVAEFLQIYSNLLKNV